MDSRSIRVLVVDDYKPWQTLVVSLLKQEPSLSIVGEASDGLEAVLMAEQLQPDLILLDIGLPHLTGLEAARRIRKVSPSSKIIFVSENRSRTVAEQTLTDGAEGYVVKSAAGSDLLSAINAVLQGKRFVSASLAGPLLVTTTTVGAMHTLQLSSLLMFIFGLR